MNVLLLAIDFLISEQVTLDISIFITHQIFLLAHDRSKYVTCGIYLAKTGEYPRLVYSKTVNSVEAALCLTSQTPNVLCYLTPRNSGKNGVLVCIRDK